MAGAITRLAPDGSFASSEAIVRHSVAGTGSAAPSTWDQASKNITAAVSELLSLVKVAPHQIHHIVLMLAGAGRPDDVARVLESLSHVAVFESAVRSAGGSLTVTSDMRPLLVYASELQPKLPTVVLIAGTGSLVAALSSKNETIRAGGWGPVLGDEGSGWRIALNTLKLICNWIDQGNSTTTNHELEPDVLNEMQSVRRARLELLELLQIVKRFATEQGLMTADSQLNSAILALASDRHLAARLAPAILDHAARVTDGLAYNLVLAELSALADQVAQVHKRIEASRRAWRLGLAGGLAANHPTFQELLNKELHRRELAPESIVVLDPLLAALHFAAVA